jgi:hypothetical protein
MIRHRIHGLEGRVGGRPRLGLAVAGLVAALVLAGCSAITASTASSSTATPAVEVRSSALALQQQFVQVVKQVGPSVVLIQTSQGLGSGIVFDADGNVVTNAHVVEGADSFQVTLADGKQYPARVVGSFAADDLAVLHIDAGGLHPAGFADSSQLAVGDVALAIGNPLGLQSSVTEGIVSALGRTVNEDNGVALPNVIQTSAPINPGNSGGALVDLQGQVIGIPTLAATDPQLGGGRGHRLRHPQQHRPRHRRPADRPGQGDQLAPGLAGRGGGPHHQRGTAGHQGRGGRSGRQGGDQGRRVRDRGPGHRHPRPGHLGRRAGRVASWPDGPGGGRQPRRGQADRQGHPRPVPGLR